MNAASNLTAEMHTVSLFVTPEMARQFLEKNAINRNVSQRVVKAIVWDILTGAFVCTGQGIEFDREGNLVDGQHRCHAIIESGRSVWMRVTYNAPGIEAPRDRGRMRLVGDFLLDDDGELVREPTRTTAICAALDLLTTRTDRRLSVPQVRKVLRNHKDGIDWALDRLPPRLLAPVQAGLVYAFPCARNQVGAFAEAVVTRANIALDSPVMPFVRALDAITRLRQADRLEVMLRELRALQLYCQGRAVTKICNQEDGFAYFRSLRVGAGLEG